MENCLIPGLPDDVAEECLIRVAFDRLPVLGSVCQRWKQELLSPHFYLGRRRAGLSRQLLVNVSFVPPKVTSGTSWCNSRVMVDTKKCHLTLFDQTSGTWHPFHHFPIPPMRDESITFYNSDIVGVGHSLVTIVEPDMCVQIYDFLRRCWRKGASMPAVRRRGVADPPRRQFANTSDSVKRLFIAGGYSPSFPEFIFPSVMSYDREQDTWEALPDMVKGCKVYKLIFKAGILYAFCSGSKTNRSCVNMYLMDLLAVKSDREWKGPHSIYITRSPDCLTISEDGKIYYCDNNKLWLKDGEITRELVDLGVDTEINTPYLTSSNTDLLVIQYCRGYNLFGVHALALKGDNQKLLWIPSSPGDRVVNKRTTWLEI